MPVPLLLDSNILSSVLRPDLDANKPVAEAILRLQEDSRVQLLIPEIVDYEVRRKLVHLDLLELLPYQAS